MELHKVEGPTGPRGINLKLLTQQLVSHLNVESDSCSSCIFADYVDHAVVLVVLEHRAAFVYLGPDKGLRCCGLYVDGPYLWKRTASRKHSTSISVLQDNAAERLGPELR